MQFSKTILVYPIWLLLVTNKFEKVKSIIFLAFILSKPITTLFIAQRAAIFHIKISDYEETEKLLSTFQEGFWHIKI